jgi:hypothetical protein
MIKKSDLTVHFIPKKEKRNGPIFMRSATGILFAPSSITQKIHILRKYNNHQQIVKISR